jgi:hypothetical protein
MANAGKQRARGVFRGKNIILLYSPPPAPLYKYI